MHVESIATEKNYVANAIVYMASFLKDCVKTGFGKESHFILLFKYRLILVNNPRMCQGVVFFKERIVRIA